MDSAQLKRYTSAMTAISREAHDRTRYRLGEIIGEGGMGTVWSAVRVLDGAEVAIKVLKAQDVEQLQRLVREARIAQRLQHDNVVYVHEILAAGELGPGASATPSLVMERLHGESLRERLGRRDDARLPLGEVARIVLDVATALEAAHALGIVHRDLKPENVFLHRVDDTSAVPRHTVVKVLDFGIAKVAIGDGLHTAGMTRTGTVLGTPYYMAPEQVFGEGDVDGRADLWALGVLLFECLAGARPFDGENPGQIWKAIALAEPPSLHASADALPVDVSTLVARLLSRARQDRPSFAELRDALVPFADPDPPQVVVTERRCSDAAALAPTVHADDAAEAQLAMEAVLTPASFVFPSDDPTTHASAARRFGVPAAVIGVLAAAAAFVLVPRLDSAPRGDELARGPAPLLTITSATTDAGVATTAIVAEPTTANAPVAATATPRNAAPPPSRAPRPKPSAAASVAAPVSTLPGGVRAESPY